MYSHHFVLGRGISVPQSRELSHTHGTYADTRPTQGALLTLGNAKAHLHHFCAVSSRHSSRYVDLRPEFATTKAGGLLPWSARVTLPSFVHPSVREASSSRSYHSEATAVKDAAFEAYIRLHKAELVNDNLLPLHEEDPEFGRDEQASIIPVAQRRDSWKELFKNRALEDVVWHAGALSLSLDGKIFVSLLVSRPTGCNGLVKHVAFKNEIGACPCIICRSALERCRPVTLLRHLLLEYLPGAIEDDALARVVPSFVFTSCFGEDFEMKRRGLTIFLLNIGLAADYRACDSGF